MVKFVLDTSAQKTAAFAFDDIAVKGQTAQDHLFRAFHGGIHIGHRKTAFVTGGFIGGVREDLRINEHQRHPGEQLFFAGGGDAFNRFLRNVDDHHPFGNSVLGSCQADTIESHHGFVHFLCQTADIIIHGQDRFSDLA